MLRELMQEIRDLRGELSKTRTEIADCRREILDFKAELHSCSAHLTALEERVSTLETSCELCIKLEDRDVVFAERMGLSRRNRAAEDVAASPRPRTTVVRLARRHAACSDISMLGEPRRFFVNERLTRLKRQLLALAWHVKRHHAPSGNMFGREMERMTQRMTASRPNLMTYSAIRGGSLHKERPCRSHITFNPEETVKALKLKIEVEKGKDYAAGSQRLIYAGKILLDENKISSYNMDEKKFIVIMVTKSKPSEIQASSTSTAEAGESASVEVGDNKVKNIPEETPKPSTPAETERTPEPIAPVISGELDFEATVQSIMDMGYNRQQVEQALRASFNNRERAVEYLITGIPEELLLDQVGEEISDEDPLAFLRDQPQFQQMRAVIQQNPNLLNTVLQQIGQTNPALLQVISQHQQAFVRMLNEPANPTSGSIAAEENVSENQLPPQPQNIIQVSPQDKEAIERLKALGFPEHMVIQAYFACEKNENLAANFLLSQNYDD
ncbi:unnamed protein product, partial [Iphiclides podalirius]